MESREDDANSLPSSALGFHLDSSSGCTTRKKTPSPYRVLPLRKGESDGLTVGLVSMVLACVLVIPTEGADFSPNRVTITDVSGRTHTGRIKEFAGSRIVLEGKDRAPFALSDLLRIDWDGRKAAMLSGEPLVLLANGDRLALRPVIIDEEHLIAEWVRYPAWPELRIPLETVRGIVFAPPQDRSERQRLGSRILEQTEPHDVLSLVNGDRITGEFQGLDSTGLKIESAGRQMTLAPNAVRALGFNPQLTGFPKTEGVRGIVSLSDGSRVTAKNPALGSDGVITIEADCGVKMSLPAEEWVSWLVLGGKGVYLSDLEPQEYRFTPYLGLTWPLERDRNVLGGVLKIRDHEFAKGLGVHSQASVSYRLDGKYKRFQATIGIDDAAGGQGSVIFRVLADGKPIYTSPIVRGNHPAIPLEPLSLAGAKTLTLVVDFADFGDVQDHADWCDAVLIK